MSRGSRAPGLALAALCALVSAAAGQKGDAGPLDRLSWLTGCWQGASEGRFVEEHWLPARAGTMVSAARATRGDRTTSVELVVLRVRGDTLVYHAYPVGQAPTPFPAVELSDSAVTFANPEHDFPQRIIYRRVGADSLVARAEGPRDGRVAGSDYAMRRVECPARR